MPSTQALGYAGHLGSISIISQPMVTLTASGATSTQLMQRIQTQIGVVVILRAPPSGHAQKESIIILDYVNYSKLPIFSPKTTRLLAGVAGPTAAVDGATT